MNVLVTGATGFVGINLIRELVKRNVDNIDKYNITAIGSSDSSQLPGISKFLIRHANGVDYTQLDKKYDLVFHQAGYNDTQCDNKKEMMLANYEAPKELFERLADGGCTRFVYASSTSIYGDINPPYKETDIPCPLTYYAESKLSFENFATQFSKDRENITCGLRYCNVYGPKEDHKRNRMSMIGQIINRIILDKTPVLFENGDQKRDWIYVHDVALANIGASTAAKSGIYNCATGVATTFNEIVNIVNEHLNKNLSPSYITNPYEEAYQEYTKCDISLIKKDLDFTPKTDLKTGIFKYIQYLKNKTF